MTHDHDTDGFDGTWWRHPPLRHALLSGLIADTGVALAHPVLNLERIEKLIAKRETGAVSFLTSRLVI